MTRVNRTEDRPFPWRCGNCGEKEVYRSATHYTSTVSYEGQNYEFDIPHLDLPKCAKCGEVVFDNHAGHQIDRALRHQLGLLQPDQIRCGRTQLSLNRKDFAARLGVAEESISRWETGGQMQSRVADRQIRLFFELPAVRQALSRLERGEPIGETVQATGSPETPASVG